MRAKFVNEAKDSYNSFIREVIKYLHDVMLYDKAEIYRMIRKAKQYTDLENHFNDGNSPKEAAEGVLDIWLNE